MASPVLGELEGISEEMEVLEGTAKGWMGSLLSRSERIEKMRREREEIAEKRKMVEERGRWMGELKDVLGQGVKFRSVAVQRKNLVIQSIRYGIGPHCFE